jgi:hypothetical protein
MYFIQTGRSIQSSPPWARRGEVRVIILTSLPILDQVLFQLHRSTPAFLIILIKPFDFDFQ